LDSKENRLDKIIRYCNKAEFIKALYLINEKIDEGDTSSELYRIKGQIELELGEIDECINSLKESLKLDDKNESTLLLVGNVYANHKNDLESAMTYYNHLVSINKSKYITFNQYREYSSSVWEI